MVCGCLLVREYKGDKNPESLACSPPVRSGPVHLISCRLIGLAHLETKLREHARILSGSTRQLYNTKE